MAINPLYLGQQGFLLLGRLPPDLGDLVDLRVEEAVLGPICFHIILRKARCVSGGTAGILLWRSHPQGTAKDPSQQTQRGSLKDFSSKMW